jgi:uncharacterized protein
VNLPTLVGMIHLAPLPGSPGFGGSLSAVVNRARREAALLADSGFEALMVENFGDAPFFADDVPPVTVAAMTRVATEIRQVTNVSLGVNVLRNDGMAAVAVAAAVGARMIRVNVLSGSMATDQGPVVGRAAEVVRSRRELAPDAAILADVFVKHATPPPGLTLEQAATDTWERGGADALVVSGPGSGRPTDLEDARRVRSAVPAAPLVIGSGATPETLAGLAEVADCVIVGTALKAGGETTAPLDPVRVADIVDAARSAGLL